MRLLRVNTHVRWNRNTEQMNEKKSEWGKGLLKPCVWGSAMQPVGARKERWQGVSLLCYNQGEEWQRIKAGGAEMHDGKEDGLALCGHVDVEIKFDIPSCFIAPFIREQVQGHLNLPLLVKSHQRWLAQTGCGRQIRSCSRSVASEDEKQGGAEEEGVREVSAARVESPRVHRLIGCSAKSLTLCPTS